jgi:hypothetical protein
VSSPCILFTLYSLQLIYPSQLRRHNTYFPVNRVQTWMNRYCTAIRGHQLERFGVYLMTSSPQKDRFMHSLPKWPKSMSIRQYVNTLSANRLKHFTMTIPDGGPVDTDALACSVTHETDEKEHRFCWWNNQERCFDGRCF